MSGTHASLNECRSIFEMSSANALLNECRSIFDMSGAHAWSDFESALMSGALQLC